MVQRELEAVRQKGLEHGLPLQVALIWAQLAQLIHCGAAQFRFDIVFFRIEPVWHCQDLRTLNSISQLNEFPRREVRGHETVGLEHNCVPTV